MPKMTFPSSFQTGSERDEMDEHKTAENKLTRRELLRLAGGAATASAFAPIAANTASNEMETDKPNIVLIMADDMGWSDAGCYGGEIETPHLDGLAAEGLRFNNFCVNPVCVPTRASLMTGLYCWVDERNTRLSPNLVTVAQLLRSAGYRTSISGKWNVPVQGSPLDWGFDEYYGFGDIPSNYFNPALRDLKFGGFRPPVMHNHEVVSEFAEDYYLTDAINDHAVETIKHFSKQGDPFFAYVAHLTPHSPLQAKQEDVEKYRGRFISGWEELRRNRFERQLDMGLLPTETRLPDSVPDLPSWSSEEHKEWQDLRMAIYAGMIDCMDQGIGRILQALKDCDADRNTIVLFLSDNGGDGYERADCDSPDIIPGGIDTYCSPGPGWGSLHNTPLRSFKESLYEGGVASPLIVRWRGVTTGGGAITHEFGHVMDILPTLCEAAGVEYPEEYDGRELDPCEGKSLLPVFRGNQREGHDWLFWRQRWDRAVRHGNWKSIGHGNPADLNSWELYDLEADRTESLDLAAKHPDVLKRMIDAWGHWSERLG